MGNKGGDVSCVCEMILFTRYVITIPDIMLPPSRLGSLMSVRGVEIYSGFVNLRECFMEFAEFDIHCWKLLGYGIALLSNKLLHWNFGI